MKRLFPAAVALTILAIVVRLAWPSTKPTAVSTPIPHVVDASTSFTPADPTARSALEVTAAGATMIAIRSATYHRAIAGTHALVSDLPLGEYDVYATVATSSRTSSPDSRRFESPPRSG